MKRILELLQYRSEHDNNYRVDCAMRRVDTRRVLLRRRAGTSANSAVPSSKGLTFGDPISTSRFALKIMDVIKSALKFAQSVVMRA